MRRMLALLCGFIIFQNIALRTDGADVVARGGADSVRDSTVILEDDFNDSILDGTKWAHIGISNPAFDNIFSASCGVSLGNLGNTYL